MRIGFDTTPLCYVSTGVANYTTNILKHLQKNPTIDIAQLSHCDSNRSRFVNKTLWMQMKLPFDLRRFDLDICHFTNNVAPVFTPCPTVITIHDMTLWQFPQFHYYKRLISMRPLIPLAARHAAAIITVSNATKNDIVNILDIPAHKVHVIYEAPSTEFRPIHESAVLDTVRRTYNLPEQFILFVGTLEPRKNLVRLLRAFEKLHKQSRIPHHLVIAGAKGWKTKEIFATLEQLNLEKVVHLLGYVSQNDLPALFNQADVLTLPSLYEGFGLPVVEAMACGTPVVTSRCGSLAEIAGEAVEYVEPTDIDSIVMGLRRVLMHPDRQQELSTLGLQHVRRFSWEQSAQQTVDVYRYVLNISGG